MEVYLATEFRYFSPSLVTEKTSTILVKNQHTLYFCHRDGSFMILHQFQLISTTFIFWPFVVIFKNLKMAGMAGYWTDLAEIFFLRFIDP